MTHPVLTPAMFSIYPVQSRTSITRTAVRSHSIIRQYMSLHTRRLAVLAKTSFQHIPHLLDEGDRHMAFLYDNAFVFGPRNCLFCIEDFQSMFNSPCIRRPLFQLSKDCKHNKTSFLSLCLRHLGSPALDGLVAGLYPLLHYDCKCNSQNRAGLPPCRVLGFKGKTLAYDSIPDETHELPTCCVRLSAETDFHGLRTCENMERQNPSFLGFEKEDPRPHDSVQVTCRMCHASVLVFAEYRTCSISIELFS